jgi:Fe-S cluster assembly protein SufD
LPTAEEEVWRYSRIDQLEFDAYATIPGAQSDEALPTAVTDLVHAAGPLAALAVVRDGRLASLEVDERSRVAVVDLAASNEVDGSDALASVASEVDAFGALNVALAASPLLIRVGPGITVQRPVVVVHWITADSATVAARTIVQVDAQAELTVVEILASADGAALVVPVTEMDLGDAAHLHYASLQLLGRRCWQVGYQASQVGRDATFRSSSVALGGDYARVRTDSRIVGQGGTSQLSAVYFGAGDQMHDFRTLQDHAAPKSTSDLLFKGAVADRSHSVYSGLIRVRKGAAGTNAIQTNRNLVLGSGAHADSVPNLEIEENEVRCNHASAVGPIDEEQRFYVESRGVPPEVAERLIVLGFLDEVLERVPVAGVHTALRRQLADKLDVIEVE